MWGLSPRTQDRAAAASSRDSSLESTGRCSCHYSYLLRIPTGVFVVVRLGPKEPPLAIDMCIYKVLAAAAAAAGGVICAVFVGPALRGDASTSKRQSKHYSVATLTTPAFSRGIMKSENPGGHAPQNGRER